MRAHRVGFDPVRAESVELSLPTEVAKALVDGLLARAR